MSSAFFAQVPDGCFRDHLARMQSHPKHQCPFSRCKCLLHAEGGLARQERMALLRAGSSEERHDAVPQGPHYRAVEALNRLAHSRHRWAQALHRLLRVEPGDKFCRAHDVDKEHGCLLAFANGPPRRVRSGRRQAQRSAAGPTKPRIWPVFVTTFWAFSVLVEAFLRAAKII